MVTVWAILFGTSVVMFLGSLVAFAIYFVKTRLIQVDYAREAIVVVNPLPVFQSNDPDVGTALQYPVGNQHLRGSYFVGGFPLLFLKKPMKMIKSFIFGFFYELKGIVDRYTKYWELAFSVGMTNAPLGDNKAEATHVQVVVAWSPAEQVPRHNVKRSPGDHGGIALSLLLRDSKGDPLTPMSFPGEAVMLYSEETLAQLMGVIARGIVEQVNNLFGCMDARGLMTVSEENPFWLKGLTIKRMRTIPARTIRDREFTSYQDFLRFANKLLTKVCRDELIVFGVYINRITIKNIKFPAFLVARSLQRAALTDEAAILEKFGAMMKKEVMAMKETGMDPNLIGAFLANKLNAQTGVSESVLLPLIMKMFKS